MGLADPARAVLTKLCTIKSAFLFGAKDGDADFKLMAGSRAVDVARPAVNELLSAGFLDDLGGGEGSDHVAYVVSDQGCDQLRKCKS